MREAGDFNERSVAGGRATTTEAEASERSVWWLPCGLSDKVFFAADIATQSLFWDESKCDGAASAETAMGRKL